MAMLKRCHSPSVVTDVDADAVTDADNADNNEPSLKQKKIIDDSNEANDAVNELSELSVSMTHDVNVDDLQDAIKDNLEVNSVLCFLCNKIDNYPRKLLKSTVLGFFRDDEVLSAKQALHQLCIDANKMQSVQQFFKRRIGENKKKANVEDILSVLYILDEHGPLDFLPVFCVADTSRIPVLTDEMSDTLYVRKMIDELRSQLADINVTLSKLSKLKSSSDSITKSCCSVETQTDGVGEQSIAAVQTDVPVTCNVAVQAAAAAATADTLNTLVKDAGTTTATINASSADRGVSIEGDIPGGDSIRAGSSDGLSYSGVVRSLKPAAAAAGASTGDNRSLWRGQQKNGPRTDEDGFVPVVGRKNQRRRNVIVGDCRSTSLHGVEKKSVVCVNRLSPETSEDEVATFLEGNGVRVFSCSLVQKRASTDEAAETDLEMETDNNRRSRRFVSMRVSVSQSDVGKIMSSELWPRGVTVRPWTFKVRPTNNNKLVAGAV